MMERITWVRITWVRITRVRYTRYQCYFSGYSKHMSLATLREIAKNYRAGLIRHSLLGVSAVSTRTCAAEKPILGPLICNAAKVKTKTPPEILLQSPPSYTRSLPCLSKDNRGTKVYI